MTIALIIFLGIAASTVIYVVWSRSKGVEILSFWDAVRNPDAMPDLRQFHKHVEDSAISISGSPDAVAGLVDYFVFEAPTTNDAWSEKRIIAKLGEEAYPRSLEILRDTSNYEKLIRLTENEHSLPEAPICRLCDIFDQDTAPPQEVAELLAPYLLSTSPEIKKSAALIIGSVGLAQSLPDLRRALKDQNEYVRSYALMGIQRAVSGGRITDDSKGHFFEMVEAMWPDDTNFHVSEKIPLLLLELDLERAANRLLAPDLFTAKFKPVSDVLHAFVRRGENIPRQKLLALIKEASEEAIEYSTARILEGAFSLLGCHRNEEDLSALESMVDHPNEYVSRGAVKGLYNHHQFFEVVRDPWDVVKASGWEALTEAEKHICAVEELDGEVNNGGFAQYYFNSAGNHWREAFEGLAALGARSRHKIMAATIEKFGATPPDNSRKIRNKQLSKMVRKKEDPFNEQDSAWFHVEDELLDRLMFRYNLSNMKGREKLKQGGVGGYPNLEEV